jgi:polyhydroxyalkanoate synthesis regulator phasin
MQPEEVSRMSEKIYKHHSLENERSSHELEDHNKEILDKLVEKGRESSREHAERVKETLEDIRAEANKEAAETDEVIHSSIKTSRK